MNRERGIVVWAKCAAASRWQYSRSRPTAVCPTPFMTRWVAHVWRLSWMRSPFGPDCSLMPNQNAQNWSDIRFSGNIRFVPLDCGGDARGMNLRYLFVPGRA